MSRYEVIGIPLGASVVAGAIRKLPEPRKQEPKRAAPGKQNS